MAANNFWITSIEVGRGLMVRLSGELDMAGAEEVRRFIESDLSDKQYAEIRFDCRAVTFIDSIGVKALLHLARRCAEMGVQPEFRMSARIERVLAAMGLGSLGDLAVTLAG
jgi:anti-anti-sigma factor